MTSEPSSACRWPPTWQPAIPSFSSTWPCVRWPWPPNPPRPSHGQAHGHEQEGRDSLLHRIEEAATRITLREVAELDLATEIYQAVNEANRAAPSARRSSLASIEHAALAFARFFLEWIEGRPADAEPTEPEVVGLVTGLRNLLVEKGVVDSAYRLDAAGEAAAAALNFVEHHCRGDCPHRCLDLRRPGWPVAVLFATAPVGGSSRGSADAREPGPQEAAPGVRGRPTSCSGPTAPGPPRENPGPGGRRSTPA